MTTAKVKVRDAEVEAWMRYRKAWEKKVRDLKVKLREALKREKELREGA